MTLELFRLELDIMILYPRILSYPSARSRVDVLMFDLLSISLGHRATVFAFCSKPSPNLIRLLNSLPGSR